MRRGLAGYEQYCDCNEEYTCSHISFLRILSIGLYFCAVKAKLMSVDQKRYQEIVKALAEKKVRLVAVSKTKPIEDIKVLYDLGQRDFGENYVQEALPKIKALSDLHLYPAWHFIGTIQSNKIQLLAHFFSWVHTVQTVEQAQLLH